MRGEPDVVIFMTGVGVRALLEIVETRYERTAFLAALDRVKIVTRGSKPESALREFKLRSVATATEPTIWYELMTAIERYFGESLKTPAGRSAGVWRLQPRAVGGTHRKHRLCAQGASLPMGLAA